MTQRREIKQRSPAVWAKVREAYLAGEPAASVARRFDVGVGNLRYRANAEGWTRKAALSSEQQAEDAETMRLKGEVVPLESTTTAERAGSEARKDTLIQAMSPREQMAYALKRAARSLAAGRASEAEGLIRAVRALGEITGTTPPRLEDLEADPTEDLEGIIRAVEYRAWQVAASLCSPEPDPPPGSEIFYFHLRDRYGRRRDGGANEDRLWAEAHRPDLLHLWDAGGRVAAPPEPSDHETKVMVSLLAMGLRQRRDGNLKAFVAEAMSNANDPLHGSEPEPGWRAQPALAS